MDDTLSPLPEMELEPLHRCLLFVIQLPLIGRKWMSGAFFYRCSVLALISTVLSPIAVEAQAFVLKNVWVLCCRCHVFTL